jgi:hypothetical protein
LLTVTAPGAGWTITTAAWTIGGATPQYSVQTVPNPSLIYSVKPPNPALGNQFVNTKFNVGAQNQSTIGFYWGELPGQDTISATATVKNANLNFQTQVKVSRTTHVSSPGWTGKANYLKSASIQKGSSGKDVLSYGNAMKPGITWTSIVPKAAGMFSFVQLVTAGGNQRIQNGVTLYGFRHVDTSTKPPTITAATFPLLDASVTSTTPFAGVATDWPYYPLGTGTTTLNESFKDYVMYQPPGGIWVPMGYFTWKINATASKRFTGRWTVSPGGGSATDPIEDHTDWPKNWTGVSNYYSSSADK